MASAKFKRKIPRESGGKSSTEVAYDLTDVPALLPDHSDRMFLAGIHPLVAKHRGYNSIRNRVEAQRLSLQAYFNDRQLRTPGLLIPGHSLTSQDAPQYRSDDPRRDKNGRRIKYESPIGGATILDVHPFVRRALGLPLSRVDDLAARRVGVEQGSPLTIVIVESRFKADAFISRGIPAIGLQGVWSWWDGKAEEPRPDFDLVPWSDLRVVLVPDSNVTKFAIHQAFQRLLYELRARDAIVTCKRIPQSANGKHQGPDDWFGRDKTAEDFWALPEYDLDKPHPHDPEYLKRKYSTLVGMMARDEVRREQAAGKVSLPDRPLSLAEALKREPPEITWAIHELHIDGGNTVLIGPRKSGKSSLAITAIRSLADGEPFLGRNVDRIPAHAGIVILNLEMAEAQWNRWAGDTGVRRRQRIYPVHLRGTRFAITEETTRLWLVALLREMNARWVALDSWGKAMANCNLNENLPADVNVWTAAWDEIKAESDTPNSLVLAHSSFKRRKGQGDDDKELARGGTSLEDWADSIWRLRSVQGTRFFEAQGRDVVIPETAVNYDAATRLYAPGYGTRADLALDADAEQLAKIVEGTPGINWTDLRNATKWPHNRTDNASRRAQEQELIRIRKKGKERQYFPGPKP